MFQEVILLIYLFNDAIDKPRVGLEVSELSEAAQSLPSSPLSYRSQ